MTNEPGTTKFALRAVDLEVRFSLPRKSPFGRPRVVHAVDGVSLSVARGSTVGLVGESGSGKTTTALALLRLQSLTGGRIWFGDEDITNLEGEKLRRVRRNMQIIYQDPYSSLNPRRRVGAAVREPLDLMEVGKPRWRERQVLELFNRVGLRPEQAALFPHQFSGGQRQRIGIARALATKPDILVCDEPVSALDVAVQAQILNLMRDLKQEFGLTYLVISHDLGVVQRICDEVAVMYLGRIVEKADRHSLFSHPLHPYTRALLAAVPRARGRNLVADRIKISGDPPSPVDLPRGCRFASRCPIAEARCHREDPKLVELKQGHWAACHFAGQ